MKVEWGECFSAFLCFVSIVTVSTLELEGRQWRRYGKQSRHYTSIIVVGSSRSAATHRYQNQCSGINEISHKIARDVGY